MKLPGYTAEQALCGGQRLRLGFSSDLCAETASDLADAVCDF